MSSSPVKDFSEPSSGRRTQTPGFFSPAPAPAASSSTVSQSDRVASNAAQLTASVAGNVTNSVGSSTTQTKGVASLVAQFNALAAQQEERNAPRSTSRPRK